MYAYVVFCHHGGGEKSPCSFPTEEEKTHDDKSFAANLYIKIKVDLTCPNKDADSNKDDEDPYHKGVLVFLQMAFTRAV